tara:strand:- start:6798 stop:7022 length:225 start_codon:yes stop_codon:yes gene_type:complete
MWNSKRRAKVPTTETRRMKMHGNMNQVKRLARKQPIKQRRQPWKIARAAQRRDKQYRQNATFASGAGRSRLRSA